MARKSRHTKGTQFTVEISDAIRHHSGEALALDSKRDTAFETRDNALSNISEAEANNDEDALHAAREEHSKAVIEIDDLNTRIKWHTKQVLHYGQTADKPGVEVLYEMPDEPPASPKGAKKPKGDDKDQLKIQPEAPVPQGENQHLDADIAELDLTGPCQAKLRKSGFNKINQIVRILDDESQDIRTETNLGENQASDLKEAVEKYRRKHRKAMAQAEREALNLEREAAGL